MIFVPLIPLFQLLQPILVQIGIDHYILANKQAGLMMIVAIFGVCVCLEFVCKAAQVFLFQYLGQKTVADIRTDLFSHVLTLSSTYFDKTPQGSITTRLTTDVESLNDSLASGLITLLSDVLVLIGILATMFWYSPKLTIITLLVVPPMAILVNFFRKRLRHYYFLIRSTIGKINANLQEQLIGVKVVQLFNRYQKNYRQLNTLLVDYRKATIGSVIYDAVLYATVEAMSAIMIAIMIWYSWGLGQSEISLGVLVAFVDLILKFFTPLKELSSKFAILQHALAALEKIFGLFDINDRVSSGTKLPDKEKGTIVFKSVSFAYKGYETKPVLTNVSFSVRPGQVVAIVGPTGSGKSTITRLITRLYDGYSGDIELNGVEISKYKIEALRSTIAIVTQEVQLFSASIWFNLSLGCPNVTTDDMINSMKIVQLHDWAESQPNGYDTALMQKGRNLSAGQAQLLSLARALVSPAPIIVLDEATANVDSLSERLIQHTMNEIIKRKTVIVIAHRLSTIQKADTIITMKDGTIIESGTHQELMANNQFYSKLYSMQFAHNTAYND